MTELGIEATELNSMDQLRPKLKQKLKMDSAGLNDKQLFDKLIETYIEPKSKAHPAFIMNHPLIMSPLAKSQKQGRLNGSEHLAERFELFINGMEVVNSYSE